jgi:hypothetical protein
MRFAAAACCRPFARGKSNMTFITISKSEPHHWGTMTAALLLAVWIFVCPWVIDTAAVQPAALNFQLTGALAVLLCAFAIVRADDMPEYALMAVAAWLAVSPWVLNLSEMTTRQCVVYAFFLAGMAWLGRPSFKPKAVEV